MWGGGSDVGEVGVMWGEVGEMGATCSMSECVRGSSGCECVKEWCVDNCVSLAHWQVSRVCSTGSRTVSSVLEVG